MKISACWSRLAVPRVTTAAFQCRGKSRVAGKPIRASQLLARVRASSRRVRRTVDATRTASRRQRPWSSWNDSSSPNRCRYPATGAGSGGHGVASSPGSSGAAPRLRGAARAGLPGEAAGAPESGGTSGVQRLADPPAPALVARWGPFRPARRVLVVLVGPPGPLGEAPDARARAPPQNAARATPRSATRTGGHPAGQAASTAARASSAREFGRVAAGRSSRSSAPGSNGIPGPRRARPLWRTGPRQGGPGKEVHAPPTPLGRRRRRRPRVEGRRAMCTASGSTGACPRKRERRFRRGRRACCGGGTRRAGGRGKGRARSVGHRGRLLTRARTSRASLTPWGGSSNGMPRLTVARISGDQFSGSTLRDGWVVLPPASERTVFSVSPSKRSP
jgi:hypothetical protein